MVKQENSDEAEAVAHPLLEDPKSLVGQNSSSSSSSEGASFSGAVFNISTTMIGAGIMSIPATIKKAIRSGNMTVDVLKRARLETAIWAAKPLLLLVRTVSTLVFFKAAIIIIPYLLNLTVSIVPQLWTSFKSCFFLSPLYIYIILNFIIITIAASSTFQSQSQSQNQNQNQNQKQHQQPSSSSSSSSSSVAFSSFISDNAAKTADNIDSVSNHMYSPDNYSSIQSQSLSQQQQQQPTIQSHSKEDATALLFSPSSHDNRRHSNNEMMSCHDIHIVQADDDKQEAAEEDDDDDQGFDPSLDMRSGDLLMESVEMPRPEVEVGEHINTLDTSWKAIMEGQGKAIGKYLKKSDTWDTPPRLTQLALTRTKFKGVLEHKLQLPHPQAKPFTK